MSGKILRQFPIIRIQVLPDKLVGDLLRLLDSARQLLALNFDILLVGDGVPILHSAKKRFARTGGYYSSLKIPANGEDANSSDRNTKNFSPQRHKVRSIS